MAVDTTRTPETESTSARSPGRHVDRSDGRTMGRSDRRGWPAGPQSSVRVVGWYVCRSSRRPRDEQQSGDLFGAVGRRAQRLAVAEPRRGWDGPVAGHRFEPLRVGCARHREIVPGAVGRTESVAGGLQPLIDGVERGAVDPVDRARPEAEIRDVLDEVRADALEQLGVTARDAL